MLEIKDLLLDIPPSLGTNLLASWLCVQDLAKLECAYCNLALSQCFAALAYNTSTVYENIPPNIKSACVREQYLIWLISRKVQVAEYDTGKYGIYIPAISQVEYALFQQLGAAITTIKLWNNYTSMTANTHDARLKAIAEFCPNLQRLECCEFRDANIISELFQNCPALKHLRFYTCQLSDIAEQLFGSIGRHCNKLQSLDVTPLEFTVEAFRAMIKHCASKLTRFRVIYSTPDADLAMLSTCPNLEVLNLWSCSTISESTIISIATSCTKLWQLDLTHTLNVTDSLIITLVRHCPHIQCLAINYNRWITDVCIAAIAVFGAGLQELAVEDCTHITRGGLDRLRTARPSLVIKQHFY